MRTLTGPPQPDVVLDCLQPGKGGWVIASVSCESDAVDFALSAEKRVGGPGAPTHKRINWAAQARRGNRARRLAVTSTEPQRSFPEAGGVKEGHNTLSSAWPASAPQCCLSFPRTAAFPWCEELSTVPRIPGMYASVQLYCRARVCSLDVLEGSLASRASCFQRAVVGSLGQSHAFRPMGLFA